MPRSSPLDLFHPAVREWFAGAFEAPTKPQALGWPAIARGDSTLILAPTGSGKTLTAFLWCLNRLLVEPQPGPLERCRVLYVSPLKALAVDVERNLRAPLAGIANVAQAHGTPVHIPDIAIRTGDTPAVERTKFLREPADILITTPESLFPLLTSRARERLRTVDTVIVDEIHALVPGKRGAHLALSLERLEALRAGPAEAGPHVGRRTGVGAGFSRLALQRIGLSATQRPLEEVARFLGGAEPRRRRGAATSAVAATRAGKRSATTSVVAKMREAMPLDEVEAELRYEFADDTRPATYRPVTIINASDRKQLELRIEVPVEDMVRIGGSILRGPQSAVGDPQSAIGDLRPEDAATPASRIADRGSRIASADNIASEPASQRPVRPSIWASIHPRLLELIRQHRSTLLFVNSRRLAERLAGALNELAGEPLVRSHHGSIARAQRSEVEDLLKAGQIRALVATSSLELGIDMGAIDLVVQIEAPPSVASGLQRIGRAGHQAGAVSEGIIFPKFRGDLLACAAVARAMREGQVESTRYPRNPLDVLAQHIVAMVGLEPWAVDDLFALVRRAAPYADLGTRMFEGVLDMLSGRYPSDAFAELRPRITWDRVNGIVTGREGATRVAIANAGTIPDRGLYGVFLANAGRTVRVGELDEEMVFECQVGETFTLGASTWRIEAITHDRVMVSPAPGEPGKMPFWHGDQAGRPVELGYAIGTLVRELRGVSKAAAIDRLINRHDLEREAAENLLRYLGDQAAAGAVPDDRTLVIERCLDELGDWRVCLLSPLGSRIHAPWAMAVTAQIRNRMGLDVEVMWGDEGFVVRFPEVEEPPDPMLLVPEADEVEGLVMRHLGSTSLFAARFRETAARALLLPRRRPGMRTPLWQQRKRASDLLAVASQFGSFPALLETYREILRDHFDMPALVETLRKLSGRTLRVATIDSRVPSPFAASLLFSYVANYIYDGDAPLAERRAQALSVDQAQLRELLGDAELRELLDSDAIAALERQLQHLDPRCKVKTVDGLHDLLIRIGDLSLDEIAARSLLPDAATAVRELERARRAVPLTIAGERRLVAVEDVTRYRDALGIPPPPGLPESLLEPVRDPAADLAQRYARCHAPFTARELAARHGLGIAVAEALLRRLTADGRVIEGEFRPGGAEREWCDPDVLRSLRRRSLAKLRQEIEPVDVDALGRFAVSWHGIGGGRTGLEPLLDAIEQLQGAAVPASVLERDVLPARVADYEPGMLDTLIAAGEVVWVGAEPLGERDGRIQLYLTDHVARLRPPGSAIRNPQSGTGDRGSGIAARRSEEPEALDRSRIADPGSRTAAVLAYLRGRGASFFTAIHEGAGGGFPNDTVDALWELVWKGLVTNDTLHALRAYVRPEAKRGRHGKPVPFRSRRLVPPTAEGRWSLVAVEPAHAGPQDPAGVHGKADSAAARSAHAAKAAAARAATEWGAAMAQQLLTRHGIVTRETVAAEAVAGGFSTVYQVLKAMEDAGRIRRGYFVAGLGAAQFAMPAALDLLRSMRDVPESPRTSMLAATDPANPYGSIVAWPGDLRLKPEATAETATDVASGFSRKESGRGPTRTVGALVILVDGAAAGYLKRGERELLLFVPDNEPRRSRVTREVARMLLQLASRRGMLIGEINAEPAAGHPAARLFIEEGFVATAMGLQARTDRLRPRGYGPAGSLDPSTSLGAGPAGIGVAATGSGGTFMADQDRIENDPTLIGNSRPRQASSDSGRIGNASDQDQSMEEAGVTSRRNRGYDQAVRGSGQDVDPDSAEAGIDRDDTVTE